MQQRMRLQRYHLQIKELYIYCVMGVCLFLLFASMEAVSTPEVTSSESFIETTFMNKGAMK